MKHSITILVLVILLGFVGGCVYRVLADDFPPMLPLPPAGLTPQQELEWNGLVVNGTNIATPTLPRVAEWKDGKIIALSNDRFTICMMSKWYDVYHCTDLVKGDWVRLSRIDSEDASKDRMEYIHDNPSGMYRVIEVKKPHPPTSQFGLARQPADETKPKGGGFKTQ